MKNKRHELETILEQARGIAKEFSAHIHSLYLVGSAAFALEEPRDIDLIFFFSGEESLAKIIKIKFMQLSQLFDVSIDCVGYAWPFATKMPLPVSPEYRVYIAILDHGLCLYGHALHLEAIQDDKVWAYRWWSLYVDLLENPLRNQVQAQARVVRGEIAITEAYAKTKLIQVWKRGAFELLNEESIVSILRETLPRFQAIADGEVDFIELLMSKVLKAYFAWLRNEHGNKSWQRLLEFGLDYQGYKKFIEKSRAK